MRIKLEKRPEPSRLMLVVTPIASVLLTMAIGVVVFDLLGIDGFRAVVDIFISPILLSYKWQDVAVKAAPLIIIALGLSVGNRANVWNIGAEGQYIIGAVCAAGIGIAAGTTGGPLVILVMLLAGMAGGTAWATVPAALKTRFGVNEILSSLMLTYVATQVLGYLLSGPWKNPEGRNFPATAPLQPDQTLPILFPGTTVHLGIAIALVLPFAFWLLMSRSVFGYQIRVVGSAPNAARHGGFDSNQTVWLSMLIGGCMAGLAGALEFAGALKALNLGFPSGYGFTAIIVAFLGRLHPIGVLIAGIVLAITYVGGQVAQTTVKIPNATAGIFQALMLFFILASDVLVRNRIRIIPSGKSAAAAVRGVEPMQFTPEFFILAIVTIVGISTPILLAALGELVVEKAGVLNLGVEGMMLVGAIAGFATTVFTGNPWVGVLAAAAAGATSSLIFGFLTLSLNSNQVATGLALTIFGTGVSSLIGTAFVGRIVPQFGSIFPPDLARDPVLKVLFGYSPIVYFSIIMVVLVWWFLTSTRAGLILRAVGENDLSAHSIGYSVIGVRYLAVAFGGAMAGIGGAYFSLVITPMWAERMTAGRGWIALALVVFASWRAPRLLVGAYFFGVLVYLELFAKASGLSILPSQFWAAMPYIMTVVVLTLISMRDRVGLNAPACLGKPFLPAT